jgi:hypothetical protein
MQNKGVNTFNFSLQASSPQLLLHCNSHFGDDRRQWLRLAFYLTFKASRLFYPQLPDPRRRFQIKVLAAFRRCSGGSRDAVCHPAGGKEARKIGGSRPA